jgi:hypothetical protein
MENAHVEIPDVEFPVRLMQPSQYFSDNNLVRASVVVEAWRIHQSELGRSVIEIVGLDFFSPSGVVSD